MSGNIVNLQNGIFAGEGGQISGTNKLPSKAEEFQNIFLMLTDEKWIRDSKKGQATK